MILPDLNLLIYALDASSPRHAAARAWLSAALRGPEPVALAWVVLLGCLRLITNPRVVTAPRDVADVLDLIDGWLALQHVRVVEPTDRHARILRELLTPFGAAGNLTTDAHLAALAIEHGASLCSADADFSRFGAGLRWQDPLR